MAMESKPMHPALSAGKYCARVSPASAFVADWLKTCDAGFQMSQPQDQRDEWGCKGREQLLLSLIG